MKVDATMICIFCVVIMAAMFYLDKFFTKKTSEERIATVKSWLLFCVTKMESVYGSGTGQIKLRAAWDLALQRFPFLSTLVTFEEFSEWVDEALVEMKKMLGNFEISKIVEKQAI